MEDEKNNENVRIDRLFTAEELGLSMPETHPNRAIQMLLEASSDCGSQDGKTPGYVAIAPRRIYMRRGIVLLVMIDGDPQSGAMYIYDRETGDFYDVRFAGRTD